MDRPIHVGGSNRYELLRGVTEARRRLETIAHRLVGLVDGVCAQFYHNWGITGILVRHGEQDARIVDLEFLGQRYRLAFDVARDAVGTQAEGNTYEYYLVLSTWKRVAGRTVAHEFIREDRETWDWRRLKGERFVDGEGMLYPDKRGDVGGRTAEDELPEVLLDMLLSADCSD